MEEPVSSVVLTVVSKVLDSLPLVLMKDVEVCSILEFIQDLVKDGLCTELNSDLLAVVVT